MHEMMLQDLVQAGLGAVRSACRSCFPFCFTPPFTRASPCAHAGQPQRSAAARSRLLGYRASHPALLTDGRSERRQPLEERLKVCMLLLWWTCLVLAPHSSVHHLTMT